MITKTAARRIKESQIDEQAPYQFRAYPVPNDEGPGFRWTVVLVPDDEAKDGFGGREVRLQLASADSKNEAKALANHLNRRIESVAVK